MSDFTVRVVVECPELTELLGALVDLKRGQATDAPEKAKTEKPKAEKTKAEKPMETEKPAEEAPSAVKIPFDTVHKALLELKASRGTPVVRALLEKLGYSNVKEIPEDRFAEVLELVEARANA